MTVGSIPTRPVQNGSITEAWGQWVHDRINNIYDISTQAGRQLFIDNAVLETKYILVDGTNVYNIQVAKITTGIQINVIGERLWTDNTGSKAPERIMGIVTTNTFTPIAGTLYAGKFKVLQAKIPSEVEALEVTSKVTVEQMIIDNNNSTTTSESDPSWQSLTGTQSLQFNPSQIVITLTGSQLEENKHFQFILGSSGSPLVLDSSVQIYGDAATAAQNGYVAGQYKWYAYKSGTNEFKFVMEDDKDELTNTSQTISKLRLATPRVQTMTAHYTSQADVLKNSVWLGDLATGASLTITFAGGITTENLGQLGLSVSNTTDWDTVSGWDKVTPFYTAVTTESTSNTWWVEYKIEAVPTDNTKIKITNFDSGNQTTKGLNYRAHWLHYKGGK